jgi:hypothetical protein
MMVAYIPITISLIALEASGNSAEPPVQTFGRAKIAKARVSKVSTSRAIFNTMGGAFWIIVLNIFNII